MTTSNALFTTPFDCNTDFIDLADNCQRYCEALVEETNPARKIALCGRLASTFALLRPMLLEPIPEHLQGRRLESRCWVEVVFSLSLWERAGVRASYRTYFIFINRTLIMSNQEKLRISTTPRALPSPKRGFFKRPLPRRFTGPRAEDLNECADAAVAAGQRNPPHRLPRGQPLHCLHYPRQLPPVNEVHSGLGTKPTVERTHAHPRLAGMALNRLIIIDKLQQMPDHVLQTRIRRHGQRKVHLRCHGKLIQQQGELSRIVLAFSNA